MICLSLCLLLLLPVFRQGQNPPAAMSPSPDNRQPQSSSPTPAEERSRDEANRTMQATIEDIFKADPILEGAQIQTTVDDEAITLSGAVQNEAQHQRALQLVHPYTRWRKVVDKIIVK